MALDMKLSVLLLWLLVCFSTSSESKQLDCHEDNWCGTFEDNPCFVYEKCATEFCCCWGMGSGGEYFRCPEGQVFCGNYPEWEPSRTTRVLCMRSAPQSSVAAGVWAVGANTSGVLKARCSVATILSGAWPT